MAMSREVRVGLFLVVAFLILIALFELLGKEVLFTRTVEYRASSPSNLEEFLFYDHPSVEHRVRKAMDWKAAHMPPAR